jgi:A/G-specific adenine glycosylase
MTDSGPGGPPADFAARVVRWQREHGRHGLPWQGTRDAYRIWLSEVMLQQTQVATVIGYYARFLARFPGVAELAAAREEEVLELWSGLGYYARARNLHHAARVVAERHGGVFPATFDDLVALPGIGRSTAAAIAAFASAEARPILDGNVRRVIARHAGIGGDPSSSAILARLWDAAEARTPAAAIEEYTQGMMDLGATICVRREPLCLLCPVSRDCVAVIEQRVAELPGARARAPRPQRRIAMLVVLARGEVLLEKRPPSGIWGGLWSLPEADVALAPREFLEREWGIEAQHVAPLEPFVHAFTHYTLAVTPWRIEAGRAAALAARPEASSTARRATWIALAEADGAALPSPVRRLLRSVAAGAGTCAAPRDAASHR